MKSRQRKHLISARQVHQTHVARAWAEFDAGAPLVLTRRGTLRILELIENPPPMNAKLQAAMQEYAARLVKGSDSLFDLDLGK